MKPVAPSQRGHAPRPGSILYHLQRLGRTATITAIGALCLTTASRVEAQPTVKTYSGGPKTFNLLNYGYRDGLTFSNAQFNMPSGLCISADGTRMYVADRTNNAVRVISLPIDSSSSQTLNISNYNSLITTNLTARPVDVLVDGANNLYILNRGFNGTNGVSTNGTIIKFNQYYNYLGVIATNITNATAFAMDGSTNIYVTFNSSNILRVAANTTNPVNPRFATNILGTITNAGVRLNGIAVMDNGNIALGDGGTNSGIWLFNVASNTVTPLSGFNGPGDVFGTTAYVKFNGIERIAKAGGGMLVVADRGNHRVKVVDPSGTVTNLFGVSSSLWFTGAGQFPGWRDGPGVAYPSPDQPRAEAREPLALAVAANGDVYDSEVVYHIIRRTTGTGLTGPGGVNNAGGVNTSTNSSSTNSITAAIVPNTGYFPMGHSISVQSAIPDVFYTTDGTAPTTNSHRVTMTANAGTILWNNSTNDLTALQVVTFIGTNASAVVTGVAATNNTVGIPTGRYPSIVGGVGSTLILPVVANLRPSDQIKSFQFRVEITPNDTNTPAISSDFSALSISSNDFVRVITAAQNGNDAVYTAQSYTSNTTQGLVIQAVGDQSNVSFKNFAVVAMLSVPIPVNAQPGQSYSIQVLQSTATSDANQTAVAFNPLPATTILVTNVPYVIGDAATATWYNAGDFGDGNLANNDVNLAFYAATGIRIPDAFSDLFDAMDVFPLDQTGFVGGDGQITFLDWQTISDRSLRLDTNNWSRAWASGGLRTNSNATLVVPPLSAPPISTPAGQVWLRQAVVGAASGGNGIVGGIVDIPVYARVINGATVNGLQFRAIITPDAGAPAINQTLQFIPATGLSTPLTQSFIANEIGVGWNLNTISLPGQSSNILGTLRFTIPATAQAGQSYIVHFTNADGAPNLSTPYNFETTRAIVRVGNTPAPTPDGISDEWKIYFFGSITNPLAAATADPDGDGSSNWQEYIDGTNPTNADSRLKLKPAAYRTTGGQTQLPLQWLSAPNKVYAVDRANNLSTPSWTTISTNVGDGYQKELVETNLGSAVQFYRIRVIAP